MVRLIKIGLSRGLTVIKIVQESRLVMRFICFSLMLVLGVVPVLKAEDLQILIVAGPASHGAGVHEYPEGARLLAECLEESGLPLGVSVTVGWPEASALAGADSLVIYGDGLEDHPARGHEDGLAAHVRAGRGLSVIHFALEPSSPKMAALLKEALGGYFAVDQSINPIWTPTETVLPDHPVNHGVTPYEVEDEWYFNFRLADGVEPLLQANPSPDLLGADGPRSGNPEIREALEAGVAQTLAWAFTSEHGGRAFGFAGGHFHQNWENDAFRTQVLNGIVWSAGLDVPTVGIESSVSVAPVHPSIDVAIARGDLRDVGRHLVADATSLDQGAHPHFSPLHMAILRRQAEIALYLIAEGAALDGVDSNDRTPLHLAVERDLPAVAAALMEAGASPNFRDSVGWTPLHHAAAKNRMAVAEAILERLEEAIVVSELGGTPLHEAAASGSGAMVELLLEAGIDPTVVSRTDKTALAIARDSGNAEAIAVLTGVGAPE